MQPCWRKHPWRQDLRVFISSLHSSSLLCFVLTADVSIQLPALPSLPSGCHASQLPCLPVAMPPSCHASQPSWTLSPWNQKPKETPPSISCLSHGVYHSNRRLHTQGTNVSVCADLYIQILIFTVCCSSLEFKHPESRTFLLSFVLLTSRYTAKT